MKAVFPPIVRLLLISLLLSGCAHKLPKAPSISEDWPKHQAQVEAIKNWQATGKLAVKVPNGGENANLKWVQTGRTYHIDLSGPFGSGKLTIDGQPNSVTLTEAGQPSQTAKTAEELIRRNTGWTIPVAQLAFWVRGLPDPTSRISKFQPNPQGLIETLEQSGWKISYSEYMSVTSGTETLAMPKLIIAEYKEIRLKLAIREWQLEQAP